MANIIQIKRSSNSTEVPHFNELAVGELAVNLADGILFTKATTNGDADDIIRLGGDNYSLINASTGSGDSAGARITLNRSTTGSGAGTQVADGTFDIIGSSSVQVAHSSGQVVLSVAGGAAINKLQSDDGGSDFAVPSSGIATIAGGTGITTSDSGATLTVTADLSLTNTATMTNKTLTAPIINGAGIIFEGATADDFETTLAVTDPTADRTITLPNVTGTVVTTGDTGSVTNTMLAGSIANGKLVNDGITIGSTDTSLGDTITALVGMTSIAVDNITLDGNTLTAATTNGLTVDSAGTITLDADSSGAVGTVALASKGTNYLLMRPDTNGHTTFSPAAVDKDFIFIGRDGASSTVDMLTLDSSDNGKATFSGAITSTAGDLTVSAGSLNLTKAASAQSEINFFEATGGGTNKMVLKPATTIFDSDFEILLPREDGTIFTTGTNGILNTHIGNGAAIADTKLAKITTADKVGGESIDITSATDGNSITIVDADQLLLDDAGTTKRVLASQLKTYMDGASGIAISRIDVDGGTDLAAPALADEIIVADTDDGGATKKADIGSILDLISGDVAVDGSGVATIQANAVALGTDTTGNYIATLADAGNDFTISNSGAESAAVTIALGNADGDVSVARDLSVARNLDINGATISLGAATSETTVEDNLTVVGDLTVNGTTTTVNTSTLQVSDPLIQLADGNTGGDALDIGFFGEYADSGQQRHSGIVRDASLTALNGETHKGTYVLFSNGTVAPTTTFDASGTYDYGALVLQHLAFGTNSSSVVGNATTTPHVLAAGGTTLSHTDGFAAPGQIKRFTMDNCIIDGGSFDGSA